MSKNQLYILFEPKDIEWVQKINKQLISQYDYTGQIIPVPMKNSINNRNFIIANTQKLIKKEILANLLNFSEINTLEYDSEKDEYRFPNHSIFLIECYEDTNIIKRAIWCSSKYFDDVGTFASRRLRQSQLKNAMLELEKNDLI